MLLLLRCPVLGALPTRRVGGDWLGSAGRWQCAGRGSQLLAAVEWVGCCPLGAILVVGFILYSIYW